MDQSRPLLKGYSGDNMASWKRKLGPNYFNHKSNSVHYEDPPSSTSHRRHSTCSLESRAMYFKVETYKIGQLFTDFYR